MTELSKRFETILGLGVLHYEVMSHAALNQKKYEAVIETKVIKTNKLGLFLDSVLGLRLVAVLKSSLENQTVATGSLVKPSLFNISFAKTEPARSRTLSKH